MEIIKSIKRFHNSDIYDLRRENAINIEFV